MDIVNEIVEFFKKPEEEIKNESPEGVCNLCWGIQEYDGKIRQIYKDKQVDLINHKDSYMLFQGFVKEHVDTDIVLRMELCMCARIALNLKREKIEFKNTVK